MFSRMSLWVHTVEQAVLPPREVPMMIVLTVLAVWIVASVLGSVLIGKSIHTADIQSGIAG